MTELQEWHNRLNDIQTATPYAAAEIITRSESWASCAVGSLIYDTLSADPDCIHIARDDWNADCYMSSSLERVIQENDPHLFWLGLKFNKALRANRYDHAKIILDTIKAHRPDDSLIQTIITVIQD